MPVYAIIIIIVVMISTFVIMVIIQLVCETSDIGPFGNLTTINPQPVLPHPPTSFQTVVHGPSGVWSPVSTPTDCIMATVLSWLFHVDINIYAIGSLTPSFLLCTTELAVPVSREWSYVFFKCFLYGENVKTL